MIELTEQDGELTVTLDGVPLEILDVNEKVIAECDLDDLRDSLPSNFLSNLVLQIHDQTGFATFLFYELHIHRDDSGATVLDFVCNEPNKYWEGIWGLSTYLSMMTEIAQSRPGLRVVDLELDDAFKQLTISLSAGTASLGEGIRNSAARLKRLIEDTEAALSGFTWKVTYETDEMLFCDEVLSPLLRKMGFVDVQFSGGPDEFGRDYTFSEVTSFGALRHYGLQAKAGNVSGGNNSQIDDIIGQLHDAFAMPYVVVTSSEQRYISTFVVAISGRFTNNAKQKIFNKIRPGLFGSVYFIDQEKVRELAERYWKVGVADVVKPVMPGQSSD